MYRTRSDQDGLFAATTEHMPFAGHRTQGTIRRQHQAARNRGMSDAQIRRAEEYGFDLNSIAHD